MSNQPPYYDPNSGWQQPASSEPPSTYPPAPPPPPAPTAPGFGDVPPHLQVPTNPSGFGQGYPAYPTGNMWPPNPPGYGGGPYPQGPAYTGPYTYPPPPPNPSQPLYMGMAGQPGGYVMPGMMGPPPPGYGHPPAGSAIAVEAILAIFGFYGIGWLMSGKTTTGTLLLIGGFVWLLVGIVIAIFTAGFGLCCLFPIHAVFIVLSTVMLSNQRIYP